MEIRESARRHGVAVEDIEHVLANTTDRFVQDDGVVVLVGADRSGRLLEVGVLDDEYVIHAMPARAKFLRQKPR